MTTMMTMTMRRRMRMPIRRAFPPRRGRNTMGQGWGYEADSRYPNITHIPSMLHT